MFGEVIYFAIGLLFHPSAGTEVGICYGPVDVCPLCSYMVFVWVTVLDKEQVVVRYRNPISTWWTVCRDSRFSRGILEVI